MTRMLLVCLFLGFTGCSDDGAPARDGLLQDSGAMDQSLADAAAKDQAAVDGSIPDSGAADLMVSDKKLSPDQILKPDKKSAADASLTSCTGLKKAVTDEMVRIAKCSSTPDCTFLWGICPFGCHIPHNKTADLAKYKAAVAAFQASSLCKKCVYKCAKPGTLTCKAGSCVMTYP